MADRSEQIGGKIKEGIGKVTGDEALESKGRREDHREQTKQKIDEVKDKVAGTVEGVKEKIADS